MSDEPVTVLHVDAEDESLGVIVGEVGGFLELTLKLRGGELDEGQRIMFEYAVGVLEQIYGELLADE